MMIWRLDCLEKCVHPARKVVVMHSRFFFQAEDGIRDLTVTGVQTCALPIWALPLDGFFGLHPSLAFLQQCYAARELTVLHALASPYRERSHFDGQDVLENGSPRARALTSGWLNRALASSPPPGQEAGGALGQNVPLVMRGPAAGTSWSASKPGALDEDTLARITDLYPADPLLSVRLAAAPSPAP